MKLTEEKALYRMAAYCSKAERCEYDVRKKLLSLELEETIIDSIVNKLKKENFLNEDRFCESFIKDKLRFNKWGEVKIVFELKKKKISSSTINTAMQEIRNEDYKEILKNILTTKAKTIKTDNIYEKRVKLTRFALSRGFGVDLIRSCLTDILKTDDNEYFP